MTWNIDQYKPATGRVIKEDGTTANVGDLLTTIAANGGTGEGGEGTDYTDLITAIKDAVTGTLDVNLATQIAGEDQTYKRMVTMPMYSYAHYSGQTTEQTVHTGACTLGRVVVNTGVADKTLTIKDGTNTIAVLSAASAGSYQFDAACATSLTATPNDAGLDFTVLYHH